MGFLHGFFPQRWVPHLFSQPGSVKVGFLVAVVCICAAAFWVSGVLFSRRPLTYRKVNNRFDTGILAVFSLLFMNIVSGLKAPMVLNLLFPFFIFSMVGIGLARSETGGRKEYLKGFGGLGIILGFAGVVLCLTAVVMLWLFPYLTVSAEAGYHIIRPLGPILARILLFFFGYGFRASSARPSESGFNPADIPISTGNSHGFPFLEKVFLWTATGLAGVICVVVAGVCLWLLIRWLLSRTKAPLAEPRTGWFTWMLSVWHLILGRFFTARRNLSGIGAQYAVLLKWGQRNGIPKAPSETPHEYGSRLVHRFSELRADIGCVIDSYTGVIYGQKTPGRHEVAAVRRAVKDVKRSRGWVIRLKKRLL
jgi:hypothetical protein